MHLTELDPRQMPMPGSVLCLPPAARGGERNSITASPTAAGQAVFIPWQMWFVAPHQAHPALAGHLRGAPRSVAGAC